MTIKHGFFALLFLAQSAFASSPVWLVEAGPNRLFLAGTIHLLRASDFPLPASFESAYAQSTQLVFETDIDSTRQTAFQNQLIAAVSLPPERQISDFFSPQTLRKLETYLHSRQLTLKQFSHFKPSMLSMTLTLLELSKLGIGSDGVDQYYYERARLDHKPTLALESVQQQIEFLASMGEGQEDQMIEQTLEDIKTLPVEFPLMIQSWRDGDSKQLETLFIEPMKSEFNAVYQQLLVERNQNWLPQINALLQTPDTEMVLVGCAHLIGEDGLVAQLRKAGLRVTQQD
ncbi:MAG: TraB/GumN family protein [Gammaproteobacteria bacterium]|nr:TraB/GumN family protein [Gammaproteobacteria bacterium]MBL6998612.1 TraB/GumN family protein [Gammaproteobacteria bacterium]